MKTLAERQVEILIPAVRSAYIELTTGGGSTHEAVRVLVDANEAVMREEEWVCLVNLRPGAVFETEEGEVLVKTAHVEKGIGPCCVSLESGRRVCRGVMGMVREIHWEGE